MSCIGTYIQDSLTLQEDLTSLGEWEADWQMKFNEAKCHSMRVTWHQHHKHILFDYSLHNQTLENVQSAKYLGITISNIMDRGQHISEISSKATKTLGFLRRNLAFAPKKLNFVDLLCFCSVLCLLCFVRVCLYVLRGHLLGKG